MSENAAWERRRAQEEKDERERRAPVYSATAVGAVYALRPIAERIAARDLEGHQHSYSATGFCRGCARYVADVSARRSRKRANRVRARRQRFHRPVSRRNAARAAR